MKKWLKLIGMTIVVLILLFVVSVIGIVTLVSPNRLKPMLTSQVMKATGRQLIIDGDLAWSFFPTLGVKTGHMELGNPAGFAQPLFAEIQAAHIDVKFLPLLRNKIQSSGITLHGLKLFLVKNAQDQVNWVFSSSAVKPENSSAVKNGDSHLSVSALGLAIASIDVTDGQVVWLDEQTKQAASINDFTFHAKDISLLQPFPITMSFRFTQQNGDLSGQVQLSSHIAINMAKQLFSLRSLNWVAELQQAGKKYNVQLTGDVITDLQQQTLLWSNLRATMGELVVTGKISITKWMTQPLITSQLHIAPFDFRAWLKTTGQDIDKIQTFKSVTGDIKINTVNEAMNVQGNVLINEIEADHVKLSQVNMPLHFQNNILSLSPVTADFYQGQLRMNVSVDVQKTQPQIALDGKLVDIQAGSLLDDLGSAKKKLKFNGTTNIDMQITTEGSDAAAIQKNLNGNGHLSVVNGTLEGIDVRYYIDVAKALLAHRSPSVTDTKKTEFANMTGSFHIKNGLVQNDDLLITSSLFTTKAKGTVDLVPQKIDYHVDTFINKTGAMEDTSWADVSKIAIPVLIYGNLNDPVIRLDSGNLTKAVADTVFQKTKDDLQEKLQKKIEDQGGELLQNLLGH